MRSIKSATASASLIVTKKLEATIASCDEAHILTWTYLVVEHNSTTKVPTYLTSCTTTTSQILAFIPLSFYSSIATSQTTNHGAIMTSFPPPTPGGTTSRQLSNPTNPVNTRNGQCTHLTMTRLYTKDLVCTLCKRPGQLGWLYRCTQDRELLIEDELLHSTPVGLYIYGVYCDCELPIVLKSGTKSI